MELVKLRAAYLRYILACNVEPGIYRLSLNSEASKYASCFAILELHLLNERELLEENKDAFEKHILDNLSELERRLSPCFRDWSKGDLQYITFALSSLTCLRSDKLDRICKLLHDIIRATDVESYLRFYGALEGGRAEAAIMQCFMQSLHLT